MTSDRPFELRATYSWAVPNAVDLVTVVRAGEKLEAFEVFLASYFSPEFTDSRVWTSRDPRGELFHKDNGTAKVGVLEVVAIE